MTERPREGDLVRIGKLYTRSASVSCPHIDTCEGHVGVVTGYTSRGRIIVTFPLNQNEERSFLLWQLESVSAPR